MAVWISSSNSPVRAVIAAPSQTPLQGQQLIIPGAADFVEQQRTTIMERFCRPLPMMLLGAAALLLTTSMLAAAPLSAAERLGRIPGAFHGLWMAEPRHCHARATDESWLRIEADRLSFYESSGPVLAVVGRGRDEIGLITELSGEGSTWLHLLRMRLDSTGNRLAMEAVGLEGAAARVRCPDR